MRLTAPRIPTFLVSVVIAVLAIGDKYYPVPTIHGFLAAHRFTLVVVAYVILAIGVVLTGL